jgi:hypothetical protein
MTHLSHSDLHAILSQYPLPPTYQATIETDSGPDPEGAPTMRNHHIPSDAVQLTEPVALWGPLAGAPERGTHLTFTPKAHDWELFEESPSHMFTPRPGMWFYPHGAGPQYVIHGEHCHMLADLKDPDIVALYGDVAPISGNPRHLATIVSDLLYPGTERLSMLPYHIW